MVIGIGLLGLTARGGLQSDASDDFSFAFEHAPFSRVNTQLSEKRIVDIFADHVDDLPRAELRPLAHHLTRLCRKHHFDPAFVLSLIQVESGFRVTVVSPAGAVGLMQLMPATAELIARQKHLHYAGEASLADPYVNLSIGIAYLEILRDRYKAFSPYTHVAAYNIGPARMDELLARKSFKPYRSMKYYEAIMRGVPDWRHYGISSHGGA